jgi:hypothetical protein
MQYERSRPSHEPKAREQRAKLSDRGMINKYDHLLPPERPRNYHPQEPRDLDCYRLPSPGSNSSTEDD